MMKLSDIMSNADLSHWASLALLAAFAAFVSIVIWVLARPKKQVDRWARVPLDDQPGDRE